MVLMLDGNSKHVAHAWKKILYVQEVGLSGEKIRLVAALDLIKYNTLNSSLRADLILSYHLILVEVVLRIGITIFYVNPYDFDNKFNLILFSILLMANHLKTTLVNAGKMSNKYCCIFRSFL